MNKKKILIADDDRQVRRALKKRLTGWGYAVVESSDGFHVISQVTHERVDALILDHEMPHGNGLDVGRMIRRESDAPIIFLSGHDPREFRDTLRELPDVYFLPKPLDADRLAEILQTCLLSKGAAVVGA